MGSGGKKPCMTVQSDSQFLSVANRWEQDLKNPQQIEIDAVYELAQ
jgi:hypothetical protein